MKYWLLISCTLLSLTSQGQSIEVTTSSDTILLGNYIELKVTLQNIEGEFVEPFIEGAEIISGPNVSSSIQIINGDRSSTQSYSYFIKPNDIGYVHISPASIKNDKDTLESQPIELPVVPNPNNIIVEPKSENSGNFIFDFNSPWPYNKKKKQPAKRKYKRI